MVGYHVHWSGPKRVEYTQWEILLQILSAKMWSHHFGPIKLVCDEQTLELYKQIGMIDLYDAYETFDMSLLDGIDPDIYFAAGKILAQLQVEDEVCAFIDTDLLITGDQEFDTTNPTVFHREFPDQQVYPNLWEHWEIDIPYDTDTYPLNCALVIWTNKELRRNYASTALKFMRNNTYSGKYASNALMITAEQRMLGLYFKHLGIFPNYYIKDIYLCAQPDYSLDWMQDALGSNVEMLNKKFFHLWGHKKYLTQDPMAAAEYTLGLYEMCDKYPELNIDSILQKLNKL